MALVRVRKDDLEFNVGAAYAEAHSLDVLDEPTHTESGGPRGHTRRNGRPHLPRTSVAAEAQKKAAQATTTTTKEA